MITVSTNKKYEFIRTPNEKRQAILLLLCISLAFYVGFDFSAKYKVLAPQVVERSPDIITYQETNNIEVLQPEIKAISEVEEESLDNIFAEITKK